jgi:hypothetical protein
MGDALGSAGQVGMNTLTGLHDTGAGIRDFLAGPGSAQQPIVQQVLGSLLGAMVFDQSPGLLAKINAEKQGQIDTEQGRLNQYLDLPQGRETLASGSTDVLQGLFPHATLPRAIPAEAGPFPAGLNVIATGPTDMGPPAQAYVLPMSPEQRGVARAKALVDAQQDAFPIGQYDAPGASLSISDQGDVQVGSTIKPRADTEMLVPTDEIDAENLTAQGLSALETRFADSRGVPLVLLQHDKAAEAARIQAAKTAVVEASQLRRIGATGEESRKNIAERERQLRERPEKVKVPVPKAGDFKRRVIDRLIKMKLAGATFNAAQQELYDKLIARPTEMQSLMGGGGVTTGGTTSSGNSFTPAGP